MLSAGQANSRKPKRQKNGMTKASDKFYETMTDFESSSLNECRKTKRRTGTTAYPVLSCWTSTSQKQFISRARQSGDPSNVGEGISGESQ
jgi:hypothetical protein